MDMVQVGGGVAGIPSHGWIFTEESGNGRNVSLPMLGAVAVEGATLDCQDKVAHPSAGTTRQAGTSRSCPSPKTSPRAVATLSTQDTLSSFRGPPAAHHSACQVPPHSSQTGP